MVIPVVNVHSSIRKQQMHFITTVLESNELSLPASVQQTPASSNSNANQSLVKMVVLDGIVMGPTVCFILFYLYIFNFLIFSIVHLIVAYKT